MTFFDRVAAGDVAWADGWLSTTDCAAIRKELGRTLWRRSEVVDRQGTELRSRESSDRTSESATYRWFSQPLQRLADSIESRLCAEFAVEPRHIESWQAVGYRSGGRFGTHHDGGAFAETPAGERVLTFLLCVKAPRDGGATYFPEHDLLLEPVEGRLVVWKNLSDDGRLDPRKLHAATPVRTGRKIMLTTWSRQRPVR